MFPSPLARCLDLLLAAARFQPWRTSLAAAVYRLLLRGLHGYILLYAISRRLSSRKRLVLGVHDVAPVQIAAIQSQHQHLGGG